MPNPYHSQKPMSCIVISVWIPDVKAGKAPQMSHGQVVSLGLTNPLKAGPFEVGREAPKGSAMRHSQRFVLLLLVCVAGACATAARSGGSSRDVLTPADAVDTGTNDLYELIQRERPRWLRDRRSASTDGTRQLLRVIVNGLQAGGLDVLRTIRIEQFVEARYFTGPDATTRWGTGFGGGAIAVTIAGR